MGEAGGQPRKKLEEDKASLRAQWAVMGETVQTAKGQVGSRSETESQVFDESM